MGFLERDISLMFLKVCFCLCELHQFNLIPLNDVVLPAQVLPEALGSERCHGVSDSARGHRVQRLLDGFYLLWPAAMAAPHVSSHRQEFRYRWNTGWLRASKRTPEFCISSSQEGGGRGWGGRDLRPTTTQSNKHSKVGVKKKLS